MTLYEIQALNVYRCNSSFYPLDSMPRSHYAMALAGEVGELCNKIKKLEEGKSVTAKALESEFGDILPYLCLLAERMGVDLEKVTKRKFNKVSKRVDSSVTWDEDLGV